MSSGDNPPENELRRNWTELPADATASIFSRLRPIDVFRAQRVCRVWRRICNRHLTSYIRSIDLCKDLCRKPPDPCMSWCLKYFTKPGLDYVARQIVDRSSGNLVDVNLKSRCSYVVVTDDFLRYIVQSSKQIKRLAIECRHDGVTEAGLRSVASELRTLEELEITLESDYHVMSRKTLELVGRSCPFLKSFKFSAAWGQLYKEGWYFDQFKGRDVGRNDIALAIASTMRGLHHLKVVGNEMDEQGLLEILASCPLLESLDLTYCFNLYFNPDLEKRCEHIKDLVRPGIVYI